MGFWEKLKKIYFGDVFGSAISEADEAFFEDLEEMLILADVGMTTATKAVEELRQRMIEDKISGQEPVKECLREILAEKLSVGEQTLNLSTKPSVILVIGVNGVGKTTSVRWQTVCVRRVSVCCCAPAILSVPPPPTSWRSGLTALIARSCVRRKALIPVLCCSMPFRPPRPEVWT